MTLCPQCGAAVRDQAKFCSVCGTQVAVSPPPPALFSGEPSGATILMPGPLPVSSTAVYLTISNGQKIRLHGSATIGREAHGNTVQVNDGRMSRRHARLEEQHSQWILTDLQSANGTYVNGQPVVGAMAVQIGDQIQMGDTIFSLEATGQPQFRQELAVASPGQAIHPVNPVTPPAVVAPYGGWREWQKAPLVEGRVEHVERLTMKRDDLMQRGCMAAFLGLIAAPLAFLPFMQGSDQNVENIRVADRHSPRMVDVKIIGDSLGVISQGDIIAVWGRPQKGLFVMQRAYNYTTGHEIAVRK